MFDKKKSKIIITLGLLGLLSCIFSLGYLDKISNIEFIFPLEKEKILNSVDKFLNLQHIYSRDVIKKAMVSADEESIIYLQKTVGVDKANKLLKFLPLYCWQISCIYPRDKSNIICARRAKGAISIIVNPLNGKVIGFRQFIPSEEYKYLKVLPKRQTDIIANNFFSSIGFDISKFKNGKYSSKDTEYRFEWEESVKYLQTAKLKVKLEIFGDKVGSFLYFLDIPAKELKKYQPSNYLVLLYIILNLLVIALGVIVIITLIRKRKELNWRFGLPFALLMLITYMVDFYKLAAYKSYVFIIILFVYIFSVIINFLWIMALACVDKLFAKESNLEIFPIRIHHSILLSYVFVFSGIGFSMFAFIFTYEIFKPVNALGFYSFFSEFPSWRFSYLIPVFLSLSAAVSEEIFFRALMISFLKRYLKKTTWAIVLSTLIWSFIHISPTGYNEMYPVFIKGVILLPIGILFGYIFVRFGLICAIVTHYLHDLIVIGSSFLEFNNFRYVNENIVIMLIAVIIPLLIALHFKIKSRCVNV